MNNIGDDRKAFRERLDHFLHPARHIEHIKQLKGRSSAMSEMLDAFETSGAHPFIWGPRGIGKTSVAHTTCEDFRNDIELKSVVACGKATEFPELIKDIANDAIRRNPSFFSDTNIKAKFAAWGFSIEADLISPKDHQISFSPNKAASFIDDSIKCTDVDKFPVVIVDEFDRLENKETFQHLSDMLKQLSVIGSKVNFCFCGVTRDLNDLLGAHESVERYIYGVGLAPLTHDAIWEIVRDIEDEFSIKFDRGQTIRIGQISTGYPHFAHLILKNTLTSLFDEGVSDENVSTEIFRESLNRSASQAATRLKTAFESAVQKGTDRYIEVLYAVANSQHLRRQFKEIASDYQKIMMLRTDREGYDLSKNNGQDLRNALDALRSRGVLRKSKSGWYEYEDPMLRSFVRLRAQNDGVELSDDTFPA